MGSLAAMIFCQFVKRIFLFTLIFSCIALKLGRAEQNRTEQPTCYTSGNEEVLPLGDGVSPTTVETDDVIVFLERAENVAHIYNKNSGKLKKMDLPYKKESGKSVSNLILNSGNIASARWGNDSKEKEVSVTNILNGSSQIIKNPIFGNNDINFSLK